VVFLGFTEDLSPPLMDLFMEGTTSTTRVSLLGSVSPPQVFLVASRTESFLLSTLAICKLCDLLVFNTSAVEPTVFAMLFVMWLVGTAIATVRVPFRCP